MTYQSALTALVDPTRRTILELLKGRPCSVGELAAKLPVSRPAVSQHLRVLREAHLVRERAQGTRHIYSVDCQGLEELRDYLDRFWGDVLEAFREAAEKDQGGRDEPDEESES